MTDPSGLPAPAAHLVAPAGQTPVEPDAARVLLARTGVAVVFIGAGLLFSSFASRLPDVRAGLDLDNGGLGLLLLGPGLGSLAGLPLAGRLVQRFGAATVVARGHLIAATAVVTAGLAATWWDQLWLAALALVVMGAGIGTWDVAMNVEGAAVERLLGRTVMPRFHAGFSLGTVAGGGIGVAMTRLGVPAGVHLALVAGVVVAAGLRAVRDFLPVEPEEPDAERGRSAWREPRVLAVGLMVLAFAATEGTANDWVALAVIDGHGTASWVGVAAFTGFVSAMTLGRLAGTRLLDTFGRVPVLWATAACAALGSALVVVGSGLLVALGVLLWGLGASLGFPVGMSAAADEADRAAARVSVVSTVGYAAFLLGPPGVGALGDHVGTLDAMLVVPALMLLAALVVPAARQRA